jgi:hypothetical protein
MASGLMAMFRRTVPHRTLLEPRPLRHTTHQIRPAQSIFSEALNFCCSAIVLEVAADSSTRA